MLPVVSVPWTAYPCTAIYMTVLIYVLFWFRYPQPPKPSIVFFFTALMLTVQCDLRYLHSKEIHIDPVGLEPTTYGS